ncbi:hypothetical protein RRG08_003820 [Elysia crispata]|uniref:Uncharacterized protein n=1 Tax=Elysia crispata TaxID=231223 RepID=A0AAE0ZDQ7_9GAST|nr:hypothetical protein RRG08_003820 [Elysia crispata]
MRRSNLGSRIARERDKTERFASLPQGLSAVRSTLRERAVEIHTSRLFKREPALRSHRDSAWKQSKTALTFLPFIFTGGGETVKVNQGYLFANALTVKPPEFLILSEKLPLGMIFYSFRDRTESTVKNHNIKPATAGTGSGLAQSSRVGLKRTTTDSSIWKIKLPGIGHNSAPSISIKGTARWITAPFLRMFVVSGVWGNQNMLEPPGHGGQTWLQSHLPELFHDEKYGC